MNNIINLEDKRKSKLDETIITWRNPYHIDNIIEDLELFKKRLHSPISYGIIMCCDEPKKVGIFRKMYNWLTK